MHALPHTRGCFVCGDSNPAGLRLRFETDGRIAQTHFLPQAEHIGFRQVVHGGILATVLDEAMVWACAVQTKRFVYCAEINVRYLRPLRPEVPVLVQGELVTNRRNRLFETRGEIRSAEGVTLTTATGKYIPMKEEEAREFITDLIGDLHLLEAPSGSTPG